MHFAVEDGSKVLRDQGAQAKEAETPLVESPRLVSVATAPAEQGNRKNEPQSPITKTKLPPGIPDTKVGCGG